MSIEALGGAQTISRLLPPGGGAAAPPPGFGRGGPPPEVASITNDEGKSLIDFKGDIQSAVKGALSSYDGSGDLRSTVQGAINSVLEENGFDPDEVKDAFKSSGFDPRKALGGGGGSPFGGGFNPAALLNGGGTEDELIKSFLQQFRPGVNLDIQA